LEPFSCPSCCSPLPPGTENLPPPVQAPLRTKILGSLRRGPGIGGVDRGLGLACPKERQCLFGSLVGFEKRKGLSHFLQDSIIRQRITNKRALLRQPTELVRSCDRTTKGPKSKAVNTESFIIHLPQNLKVPYSGRHTDILQLPSIPLPLGHASCESNAVCNSKRLNLHYMRTILRIKSDFLGIESIFGTGRGFFLLVHCRIQSRLLSYQPKLLADDSKGRLSTQRP